MRSVESERIGLFTEAGVCVARLSRKAAAEWHCRIETVREVRVLAMICRRMEQQHDAEPGAPETCLVEEWEVPLVEVVFAPEGG